MKPIIPDDLIQKWQQVVNLMAEIMSVPAGLVMRVHPTEIEVFVSSHTEDNPYEPGDRHHLDAGLYCEWVMENRDTLLVPNALHDPDWDENPDIELNMISYMGMPLVWQDGEVFGTICVLDSQTNPYSNTFRRLLEQFRGIIEADLARLSQQAAQRRQDALYRDILANFPNGAIFVFDHELRIIVSGGAELEGGRPTIAFLENKFLHEVLPPDTVARLEPHYRAALQGHSHGYEYTDDMHKTYRVQIGPIHDDAGQVIGGMALTQNITDNVRNRQLLDDFMLTSPTGIMTYKSVRDEHGSIIDFEWTLVNRAAEAIVGFKAAELIGKRMLEVMPGNREAGLFDLYVQVVETGQPLHLEHYYNHENLDNWFRTNAARLGDGLSATFMDITERKQTEDALRRSEQRSRTLINNFPVGVVALFDEDLRFQLVGGKGLEAMGIPAEAWVDASPEQLFPPDMVGPNLDLMREALLGKSAAVEVHQDDQLFRVYVLPVAVNGEAPNAGMIMTQDITQERLADQQRLQLALERERTQLIASFIRDSAHEFRTPLAAMQMEVFALAESNDPTQKAGMRDRIDAQIAAIVRLVNLLVQMAELDSGSQLATETIDINELLKETINDLHTSIEQRGLKIEQELALDLAPLSGDPEWLGVALTQLVENAVRFTPYDGTIRLRTLDVGSQVVIEVIDNGVGIAPERLSQIFERFYRAEPVGATRGFGLGLPIARQIIDMHGGHLSVSSTVGEGSCFRIELPQT